MNKMHLFKIKKWIGLTVHMRRKVGGITPEDKSMKDKILYKDLHPTVTSKNEASIISRG